VILGSSLGNIIPTFGPKPPVGGYSLWIPLDMNAIPAFTTVGCVPDAPLMDNRLTYVDPSTGNLLAAQTNVPRIGGFNPATRRAGLLIEGNHNHYFGNTNSDATKWLASGAIWAALAGAPIVPGNTGQRLIATRTAGVHQVQRTLTAGIGWHGPAVLIRRVNWGRFELSSTASSPTFGTQARVAIDLDNGTVTKLSGPATLQYGIEPWGNGAYRIWLFGNSAGGSEALTLGFANAAGETSFTPGADLAVDIHHMCWSDAGPYSPSVNTGDTGANFVTSRQSWSPTGDLRVNTSALTLYFSFTPQWGTNQLDVGTMSIFDTSMGMAGMIFECRKSSNVYQGNVTWFYQYPRGSAAVTLEPARNQTCAVAMGSTGTTGFLRVKNGMGSPVGTSVSIPSYPNLHQQLAALQSRGCVKDILAYPAAHSTAEMDVMLGWIVGRTV
jgi:hypothetical protein